MNKAARAYYKGGHRVVLGGVPCRRARLPVSEGGKRAMRESSREMCLPLPPRGKQEFAVWEREQRAKYDAADKLGPWVAPEPLVVEVAVEPEPLALAVVEPVRAAVEPVEAQAVPVPSLASVEPLRVGNRYARPSARRSAMSGAMRTIHYYRVSTEKQGRGGLGMDAQRSAVEAYCAGRGCEMVAEYVEVESGKRDDRPELAKALHHAKVTGSTLVIAKLDRLSRNAAFLMTMRDAGVQFVCADMPDASNLTIGIMALVAQQEREATSRRTVEALAAAKAKAARNPDGIGRKADGTPWKSGNRLGNPRAVEALMKARQTAEAPRLAGIKSKADAFAADVMPIIDDIRSGGLTSLRQIAGELNNRGIVSARGGTWSAQIVSDIIKRVG